MIVHGNTLVAIVGVTKGLPPVSAKLAGQQSVDKFAQTRHFATLHSGFYSFFPIKAGMERSEMTVSLQICYLPDRCVDFFPSFFSHPA